jgi:hypothetical protein
MPFIRPEYNDPPFSIPGVVLPHWEIHDGIVDPIFHKQVHEYLLSRTWHQQWMGIPGEMQIFKPSDWDEGWINAASIRRCVLMPRTMFGSDLASTQTRHPIIAELWERINQYLGGCYEISGASEGMVWKDYPCPKPQDSKLDQGWRVYANATMHDMIQLQGHVHRDNIDLSDDTSVTMLWIANEEWYPSWGGEIMLYPEDPTGATGDHQQFNGGHGHQKRNFKIGWQDDGKMITMRSGRLIIFDSRTLHSTNPTRHRYNTMPNRRVVFRARKIK